MTRLLQNSNKGTVMSKLEELILKYCPDGVEWSTIGEVCQKVFAGGTPTSSNSSYYGGDIPWLRSGEVNFNEITSTEKTITEAGYNSSSARWVESQSVLVAMTGATVARSAITMIELTANQSVCALVPIREILNYRFLYYWVSKSYLQMKGMAQGALTSLNLNLIKSIEIPVPPLPVQEEIVRVLDTFTELQAELQAELQKRLQQYNYYRDNLLSFEGREDVEWKKLGEIGKVCMCKRIMKDQTSSSGDIPFFKIGTFGGNADAYIPQELYEEYKRKYSYPNKGDILISAAGTIGRTVVFDGSPSYFQDSNIVWLKHNESVVLNSYLRYCYTQNPWAVSTGGTIARLYNDNILNAVIPVPSLSEQQKIVDALDRFDTFTTDLTAGLPAEIEKRRQQYEYYRDKLLTFKRK